MITPPPPPTKTNPSKDFIHATTLAYQPPRNGLNWSINLLKKAIYVRKPPKNPIFRLTPR
ncbi:hypothetical protein HBZS_115260 [Helicobacter bizzozeronii CCUG 35545]|nr:hypothetical protein HBZS_115260 [Helicobacter bizzozeronii CCUG 35545]